jgi:bifunctional DNA-binding transcriptional regulator/antitoxin component of YhaV-PrlF toxin-antitoxin module
MAKVTSKLQVTLPKSLADRYGTRPGDEIQWESAGEVIRVLASRSISTKHDIATRLRLFDQATARQRQRQESALDKQQIVEQLLRQGITDDDIRVPHQAIIEFVAATTRPLVAGQSLLTPEDTRRAAEEFLTQFTVLYPTDGLGEPRCEARLPINYPGSTHTFGPMRSTTVLPS